MPQVKDTYVDPVLTRLSVRRGNEPGNYISERLFPTLRVAKKTGFYFTYDKSNMRIPKSERAGVTRANRVDYQLTKTAYGPLVEHSLEHAIEDDVMDQYDAPLEPRTDATMTLSEMLWLKKESKLATSLADTAVVTQNVTLSGSDQWSDYANSDPFDDIQTAIDTVKENSVQMPNTIAMGYQTWSKLMHHPDLIERVKYSQLAVLTTDLLRSLFPGIDTVLVGSAVYNSADEGATDALDFVWGKHLWVGYVTPSPGIRTVSAGYHLQLKDARVVDRWDDRSVKAEFVRLTDYFEAKMVAADCLYLIKNATA